ncbi:MAG: 6-phospho-beta-glucosidase [Gaiellales bacterium]
MKLTVIGAGGFRTPAIYRALVSGVADVSFDEIVLYDADDSRFSRITAVLDGIDAELGATVGYRMSTDLADAVEGADVVYCAIRVGGLEGRLKDERIAVDAGAIGQETTGPGGIAFALRTVPAVLAIAEQVNERAPSALFVNFTNPAGLVTEALRRVLGDRVVGICDGPPDLCKRVARAVGVPREQLWFDYFGINHLGWLRSVVHRGRDLLPDLLADDERLESFEEGRLFGATWLQAVGMIPNEYLYYYYAQREALESMRRGNLRAAVLLEQQRAFYEGNGGDGGDALAQWQAASARREASYMAEAWSAKGVEQAKVAEDREPGGYGGVALQIVDAVFNARPRVMILNTANRSAMPFLDEDAVVEVSCVVGPGGVMPSAIGACPLECQGLISQVRASERAAIEAAISGSRSQALRAFALHPLVPSVEVAEGLLSSYLDEHRLADRFA